MEEVPSIIGPHLSNWEEVSFQVADHTGEWDLCSSIHGCFLELFFLFQSNPKKEIKIHAYLILWKVRSFQICATCPDEHYYTTHILCFSCAMLPLRWWILQPGEGGQTGGGWLQITLTLGHAFKRRRKLSTSARLCFFEASFPERPLSFSTSQRCTAWKNKHDQIVSQHLPPAYNS